MGKLTLTDKVSTVRAKLGLEAVEWTYVWKRMNVSLTQLLYRGFPNPSCRKGESKFVKSYMGILLAKRLT